MNKIIIVSARVNIGVNLIGFRKCGRFFHYTNSIDSAKEAKFKGIILSNRIPNSHT